MRCILHKLAVLFVMYLGTEGVSTPSKENPIDVSKLPIERELKSVSDGNDSSKDFEKLLDLLEINRIKSAPDDTPLLAAGTTEKIRSVSL